MNNEATKINWQNLAAAIIKQGILDNDTLFLGSTWYEFLKDVADIKKDFYKGREQDICSKEWMKLTSITHKFKNSVEKLKKFIADIGIEVRTRKTLGGKTIYEIKKTDKDRVVDIARHGANFGLLTKPKCTSMLESTFKLKTSLGRDELLALAQRLGVQLIYKNNHYSIPVEYKDLLITEARKLI